MDYISIIATYLNGNKTDAVREIEAGGPALTAKIFLNGEENGLSRADLENIEFALCVRAEARKFDEENGNA